MSGITCTCIILDVCLDGWMDVYYNCLHVYIFFNICIDKYQKAKKKIKELKFIFNLFIWHLSQNTLYIDIV